MSTFDPSEWYACKGCGNVYAPDVDEECPSCGRCL